jgi:hypothetical protein
MAESSSAGPLNGEALRLMEPAIRLLSPYAAHIRLRNEMGVLPRVLEALWQEKAANSVRLVYIGVVWTSDDARCSKPLAAAEPGCEARHRHRKQPQPLLCIHKF